MNPSDPNRAGGAGYQPASGFRESEKDSASGQPERQVLRRSASEPVSGAPLASRKTNVTASETVIDSLISPAPLPSQSLSENKQRIDQFNRGARYTLQAGVRGTAVLRRNKLWDVVPTMGCGDIHGKVQPGWNKTDVQGEVIHSSYLALDEPLSHTFGRVPGAVKELARRFESGMHAPVPGDSWLAAKIYPDSLSRSTSAGLESRLPQGGPSIQDNAGLKPHHVAQLDESRSQIEAWVDDQGGLQEQLQDITVRYEQLSHQLAQSQEQVQEQQEDQQEIALYLEQFHRRDQRLLEQLREAKAGDSQHSADGLEGEVALVLSELSLSRSRLDMQKQQNVILQQKISELELHSQEIERELGRVRQESSGRQVELVSVRADLEQQRQLAAEMGGKLQEAQRANSENCRIIRELEQEKRKQQAELTAANDLLQQQRKQIKELERKARASAPESIGLEQKKAQRVQKVNLELKEKSEQVNQLSEELDQLRRQLADQVVDSKEQGVERVLLQQQFEEVAGKEEAGKKAVADLEQLLSKKNAELITSQEVACVAVKEREKAVSQRYRVSEQNSTLQQRLEQVEKNLREAKELQEHREAELNAEINQLKSRLTVQETEKKVWVETRQRLEGRVEKFKQKKRLLKDQKTGLEQQLREKEESERRVIELNHTHRNYEEQQRKEIKELEEKLRSQELKNQKLLAVCGSWWHCLKDKGLLQEEFTGKRDQITALGLELDKLVQVDQRYRELLRQMEAEQNKWDQLAKIVYQSMETAPKADTETLLLGREEDFGKIVANVEKHLKDVKQQKESMDIQLAELNAGLQKKKKVIAEWETAYKKDMGQSNQTLDEITEQLTKARARGDRAIRERDEYIELLDHAYKLMREMRDVAVFLLEQGVKEEFLVDGSLHSDIRLEQALNERFQKFQEAKGKLSQVKQNISKLLSQAGEQENNFESPHIRQKRLHKKFGIESRKSKELTEKMVTLLEHIVTTMKNFSQQQELQTPAQEAVAEMIRTLLEPALVDGKEGDVAPKQFSEEVKVVEKENLLQSASRLIDAFRRVNSADSADSDYEFDRKSRVYSTGSISPDSESSSTEESNTASSDSGVAQQNKVNQMTQSLPANFKPVLSPPYFLL